jgi:hypothetical protein
MMPPVWRDTTTMETSIDQFIYLQPYWERFMSKCISIQSREAYLKSIPKDDIAVLENAISEIKNHGDEMALGQWLCRPLAPGPMRPSREERRAIENEWNLEQLLFLMKSAGEKGLISKCLFLESSRQKSDWSQVPKEFHNVMRIAFDLASISEENINTMSLEDEVRIGKLSASLRQSGSGANLESWIASSDTRESKLCYHLLGIMDSLGLQWK